MRNLQLKFTVIKLMEIISPEIVDKIAELWVFFLDIAVLLFLLYNTYNTSMAVCNKTACKRLIRDFQVKCSQLN